MELSGLLRNNQALVPSGLRAGLATRPTAQAVHRSHCAMPTAKPLLRKNKY